MKHIKCKFWSQGLQHRLTPSCHIAPTASVLCWTLNLSSRPCGLHPRIPNTTKMRSSGSPAEGGRIITRYADDIFPGWDQHSISFRFFLSLYLQLDRLQHFQLEKKSAFCRAWQPSACFTLGCRSRLRHGGQGPSATRSQCGCRHTAILLPHEEKIPLRYCTVCWAEASRLSLPA